MSARPTLYLLTGLPCSGKTTFARELESAGAARVSVDEMMIATHGRLGVDYDHADHVRLLDAIVAQARHRVIELLGAGCDTVFDHGLGRRSERDEFKRVAETCGATWKLLWFDVELSVLRARCLERSTRPGTVPISDEVLNLLAEGWERPVDEGEILVGSNRPRH